VLAEVPEVTRALDRETLLDLDSPEGYLGSSAALRANLLSPLKLPDPDGRKE
jgi:hypothetical protein